jgi:hypothetical protein
MHLKMGKKNKAKAKACGYSSCSSAYYTADDICGSGQYAELDSEYKCGQRCIRGPAGHRGNSGWTGFNGVTGNQGWTGSEGTTGGSGNLGIDTYGYSNWGAVGELFAPVIFPAVADGDQQYNLTTQMNNAGVTTTNGSSNVTVNQFTFTPDKSGSYNCSYGMEVLLNASGSIFTDPFDELIFSILLVGPGAVEIPNSRVSIYCGNGSFQANISNELILDLTAGGAVTIHYAVTGYILGGGSELALLQQLVSATMAFQLLYDA